MALPTKDKKKESQTLTCYKGEAKLRKTDALRSAIRKEMELDGKARQRRRGELTRHPTDQIIRLLESD